MYCLFNAVQLQILWAALVPVQSDAIESDAIKSRNLYENSCRGNVTPIWQQTRHHTRATFPQPETSTPSQSALLYLQQITCFLLSQFI